MRRTLQATALAVGAAFAAAGAFQLYLNGARRTLPRRPGSAPARTAQRWFGDYAVVGRTVTINKPRSEVYAYWRDFNNLANFMQNVEQIRTRTSGESVWTISAPAGMKVNVETRIVEERENELIAWRSTETSTIATEGRIAFREAPGARGTEVEAIIAYKPPVGELGRIIAKLFQREPAIQGRRELRRFKMLMEAGEVATSRNQQAPEAASP